MRQTEGIPELLVQLIGVSFGGLLSREFALLQQQQHHFVVRNCLVLQHAFVFNSTQLSELTKLTEPTKLVQMRTELNSVRMR